MAFTLQTTLFVYSERNASEKRTTCDPWCPKHTVCTWTYKASSEPRVACFFMAHPFIIHHVNYKGGWVSGHANQWWDWKKKEAHLTLQSILMHHLQHGKWTCIRMAFYKNPLYSNTTPATPREMMGVRRGMEERGRTVHGCNGCTRWSGQSSHKKCVTLGERALTLHAS